MTEKTDALRDIFLEVSEEPTVTESQEEGPSRDPIEGPDAAVEEAVVGLLREDGLADAVDDPASGPDGVTG